MNKRVRAAAYTIAIATLLVGLIAGAGVAWVAKPAPSDMVSKSAYDTLQSNYNKVSANLTAALAKLAGIQNVKVALILGTGGLGDKSFNDIAYAGLQRAQRELNITFDYASPMAIAEYEGMQTNFAKQAGKYALIIGIGYDQADALNKTATVYPNQNFAIVDMAVDKPNVASLLFRANEGSFLVGVVGGMMTSTGKAGFVGALDIPLIRDMFVGYQAGVMWANSSATVLSPLFVGGFADPNTAHEEALTLISQGADSIYVAAGKSGLGALQAIHEQGKIGFGVDSCQDYLYAEIKASATKRVDEAVFEMIQAALLSKLYPNLTEGNFKGGIYNKGLAEGWTGCSRLPEEEPLWESTFNFTETPLPTNVLTKLTDAKSRIISGNITVPSAYS
jgi:basic membrane protein A